MSPRFTTALTELLSATVPGITVTADMMNGSLVIADAVQEGRADIGIVQADAAYLAYWHGLEKSPYPHRNLRGTAVLWTDNLHALTRRDSNIRDLSDLRGKRVGILVPGFSGELTTRMVLRAYGLSYDDMQVEFGSRDLPDRLREGRIDVAFTSYPFLQPSIAEFGRLIPIRADVFRKLRAEYPFFRSVSVPAPGEPVEVQTVGTEAILLCRKDLSDDLVFSITKQLFALLPQLAQQRQEATLIDVVQAPATPIPLHPGAARFYRARELLH
jgi:uncharacterized protein